jgi:hypothetical protein
MYTKGKNGNIRKEEQHRSQTHKVESKTYKAIEIKE